MKVFTQVWLFLLVLTGVEVFLAYVHAPLTVMLVALIGLSAVKGIFIVSYFMHLKYETRVLRWILWPIPIILTLVLLGLLPDAAHGQCIMCQRTAAAQNEARTRTLNLGILVMGVPAVAMMSAIFLRAARRR